MKSQDKVSTIEVITGPMFSGKTTELIRRCKQAEHAGLSYQMFKPALDKRYATCEVVTHSNLRVKCIPVARPLHIFLTLSPNTRVVAVDEVQLFASARELAIVGRVLAYAGKRIILAGLDTDKWCLPFGWIRALSPNITITSLTATCASCGGLAHFTQCLLNELDNAEYSQRIDIGGSEKYEPRCAKCHQMTKAVV